MEDRRLIGEYSKLTKRVFTKKELLKIKNDISNGITIAKLAKEYKVNANIINVIFKEFILDKESINHRTREAKLGYKTEEYYTEEELLAGIDYKSYTWKNLSKNEKQFYLNYGTENNNGNDIPLESGI